MKSRSTRVVTSLVLFFIGFLIDLSDAHSTWRTCFTTSRRQGFFEYSQDLHNLQHFHRHPLGRRLLYRPHSYFSGKQHPLRRSAIPWSKKRDSLHTLRWFAVYWVFLFSPIYFWKFHLNHKLCRSICWLHICYKKRKNGREEKRRENN